MASAVTQNINTVLFNAAKAPWNLYRKPFRAAPQVFYVGNTWVGSYLIDTVTDGLILIDAACYENFYLIIQSILELGYDPFQIKHILLSHCHADHAGGATALAKMTGAKIWLSKEDEAFKDSECNLNMGDDFYQPPFDVDCFYDDNTPIKLGNVTITTKLTPGHTPGTTSFFIQVPDEDGNMLTAAMHGGVGVNTLNDEFIAKWGLDPALRDRFIADCEAMKAIHVDITLPSHPAHGDMMKNLSDDLMNYKTMVVPSEWPAFLEVRKQFALKLIK